MSLRNGFTLGEWTVLPLESRLVSGETSSRVQPKSMDVLLCLAEANGEVVERDELLRQVWGDRAVSDEPLTRCIGELRRSLGDSRSDPEFILTIPKRGYRLLKPVGLLAADERPAARSQASARQEERERSVIERNRGPAMVLGLILLLALLYQVGIKRGLEKSASGVDDYPVSTEVVERSIAVLPFVDMSANQDQEYMGDGIAEELLNLLAKIKGLRVISRSSSFSLKGSAIDLRTIARQFDVAYVLEGSVRTSGDRIRITAQLVDGRTDTHVWSENYDRQLEDVFLIQDEIARAVVNKLQVTLLDDAPRSWPTNPEAYAQFLQGRYLHEQPAGDSMQRALDHYKAALDIDPEYVPAWVWLAALYDDTVNSSALPRDEVGRLARDAIRRALEIEPDDPLALGMSAVLAGAWDRDLAGSAARMQRAIDLDPVNPYLLRWSAIVLTGLGRHEDAVRVNEYLFERDPIGNIAKINLAATYLNAGAYEDAISICRIEVALSTESSPCGSRLILAYLYTGDGASALAHLQRVSSPRVHARLAPMVYHALGRVAEYHQSLEALKQRYEEGDAGLGYWLAHTYAYVGDSDAMFDWFDRTLEAGALPLRPGTRVFLRYESDPRWQSLMQQLGQSAAQLESIPFDLPPLS